ncbi:P22AR C-terminal domain-containing protein [Pasteurellaceae bacterium 22721_9_1]
MSNLTFQNTTLTVVPHNNQIFFTSTDLAVALGYSRSDKIAQIYERNADEFTADMTDTLKMRLSGNLETTVRIFSLRGAHLIAMFSRTKVAKEFRKWVLDILDKEIKQSTLPTPKPEKRYHFELTEFELEQLAWLWFSHRQMNDLLGELINPLKAIESRYSSTVYSHYHEYKRHNRDTLTVIQRFAEPFLQSERLNWQRVVKRLTA